MEQKAVEAAPDRIYRDLGVRTFINAAGAQTMRGGSRMPPVVLRAMAEAARDFVNIDELQTQVGRKLATLTQNEAAYAASSAAAALSLATAAAMVGTNPGKARQLPDLSGLPDRVVMHRAHRNPYDYAIRAMGVEIREIGFPGYPTFDWELDHALDARTAAVLYLVGDMFLPGPLSLEEVVKVAHHKGVPVIVDAAAQLPPKQNLWRFTELGADLVVFSGGKDLRGPQASGLIVGRTDLIAGCALVGAPHHGIGRAFKAGREEMVGLLTAVRWYLEQDEQARERRAERLVERLALALDRPDVVVERAYPNEAGQPLARARVLFNGAGAAERRDQTVRLLYEGTPSIEVEPEGACALYVNPLTIDAEEEEPLIAGIHAAVSAAPGE